MVDVFTGVVFSLSPPGGDCVECVSQVRAWEVPSRVMPEREHRRRDGRSLPGRQVGSSEFQLGTMGRLGSPV